MVEGVCLLVVLIGRLGPHGAGLVGVLNEIPAAVEHEFGPPAVQGKSQAPPDLLEEDGLAHPMVDVKELEVLIVDFYSCALCTHFTAKYSINVFYANICTKNVQTPMLTVQVVRRCVFMVRMMNVAVV